MTGFLNTLRTGYLQYVSHGQYIGLFFLSLLFLWIAGRKGQNKKNIDLQIYAAGATFLILFPFSAWLLLQYQTPFYTYSHLFLLLPMTAVTAWGLTEIMETALAYLEKQPESRKFAVRHKRFCQGAAITAIAAVLMLSGTVTLAAEPTVPSANTMKIPQETLEVLHILEQERPEEQVLLAPDEILEYARSYSGSFRLLYGRNMWNKELNAFTYDTYPSELEEIHKWLNPEEEMTAVQPVTGRNMTPDEAVEEIRASGCTVLVLTREQYENNAVSQAITKAGGFAVMEETDRYILLDME